MKFNIVEKSVIDTIEIEEYGTKLVLTKDSVLSFDIEYIANFDKQLVFGYSRIVKITHSFGEFKTTDEKLIKAIQELVKG